MKTVKEGQFPQCSLHSSIEKELSTGNSFQLTKQLLVHIISKFWSVWWPESIVFDPNIVIQRSGLCCTIVHQVHTSLIVRQFLARNQVYVLNHPLYSTDLAPYVLSLFPKLKLKLKGCFFNDISTIKTITTQALEAIPQNELWDAFKSLLNHCNKCIETGGEYFEKNRKIFTHFVSMMFSTVSLETYLSHCVLYEASPRSTRPNKENLTNLEKILLFLNVVSF